MVLIVALGVPSGALPQGGEAVSRGWSPEDSNTGCGYHVHPSQPGQARLSLQPQAAEQALAPVLPCTDLH